ncbi:hypothetical protein MIR68_012568 [Amoeboaphelidium protococcarum]|nr:hypothetical protein MIR68_012568 [Amoeboaphelidium protococcarum]
MGYMQEGINKLFLNIDQDYGQLVNGVKNVAMSIAKDWDNSAEALSNAFTACVSELPDKSQIFAAVLALVAQQDSDVAQKLLDQLKFLLDQYLVNQEWRKVKLLVRYLIELCRLNLLQLDEIVGIYQVFSKQIQNQQLDAYSRDIYCYLIMSTLPYGVEIMYSQQLTSLQSIWQSVSDYLSNEEVVTRIQSIAQKRQVFSNCPFPQPALLLQLGDQIEVMIALLQDGKPIGSQLINLDVYEQFQALISASPAKVLSFGPVMIPSNLLLRRYETLYQPQIQLYHPEFVSDKGLLNLALPDCKSIDWYLLNDQLQDLVVVFSHNNPQMIEYYNKVYFKSNFSPRINPHQALTQLLVAEILSPCRHSFMEDINEGGQQYLNHTYFSTLIVNLCNAFKKDYPQVLGKVFYTLFDRLNHLNAAQRISFSKWFAFHISNFDFRWNFKAWMATVSNSEGGGELSGIQSQFIKESLVKAIDLAYYERVYKALPQDVDMSSVMPAEPTPEFWFATATDDGASADEVALVDQLLTAIKNNVPTADFVDQVKKFYADNQESIKCKCGDKIEGEAEGSSYSRFVFTQAVLHLGNKSVSHLLHALDRTKDTLKLLLSLDDASDSSALLAQSQMLDSAYSYWSLNVQMLKVCIKYLVDYEIISPEGVVNWLFTSTKVDRQSYFVLELIDIVSTGLENSIAVAQMSSDMDKESQIEGLRRQICQFYVVCLDRMADASQSEDGNSAKEDFVQAFIAKHREQLSTYSSEISAKLQELGKDQVIALLQ